MERKKLFGHDFYLVFEDFTELRAAAEARGLRVIKKSKTKLRENFQIFRKTPEGYNVIIGCAMVQGGEFYGHFQDIES